MQKIINPPHKLEPAKDDSNQQLSPRRVSIQDFVTADGKIYTGELLNGKFDGKGVMVYPNKERYQGYFQKGLKNGQGKYFYDNGDLYIGGWVNNMKEGKGRYFHNNGSIYEGEFKRNKKHGKGVIHELEGNKFDCQYYENLRDGQWKHYDFVNDKVTTIVFNKGVMLSTVEQPAQKNKPKQYQLPPVPNYEEYAEFSPEKIVSLILPNYLYSKKDSISSNEFISMHLSHGEVPSEQQFLTSRDVAIMPEGLEIKNETLRNLRIDEWDTDNVAEWLQEIGFADFATEFKHQNVTGLALMKLKDNDLKELTIACESDRIVFLREIRFLILQFKKQCAHDKICKYNGTEIDQNLILKLQKQEKGFLKRQESQLLESETPKDPQLINSKTVFISLKRQISKDKTEEQPAKVEDLVQALESNQVETQTQSSTTSEEENQKQKDLEELPKQKEKNDHKKKRRMHIERKIQLEMKKKRIDTKIIIDSGQIQMGETIGKGTYGQVFLATWLGQQVAVKRYTKRKGLRHRHIARFLEQAEITSKLMHPNIVLYMGMFICNNDYAIVMEYMEGGSLFDYLHIKGYKLAESKIVQICRHVAIAMCYLHSKDIVHCDLKSSNLLLDRYWKIKLSDFGLSRIIDPNTNKQQRSTRLGTPQWMAPEVMRGEKYQPACDVYSFGMILWQLMTCEIPFRQLTEKQIIDQVGQKATLSISTPIYPNKNLVKLFIKCTKKQASERPGFIQIAKQLQTYENQLCRSRKRS